MFLLFFFLFLTMFGVGAFPTSTENVEESVYNKIKKTKFFYGKRLKLPQVLDDNRGLFLILCRLLQVFSNGYQ